ncbi:MAG TPA: hypothetical protein VMZ27_00060, partial [Candidatus Saccharimonadales bacterium]|nr:hypothetical protein [Candidatus Saccharimonadales bacterium]
MPNFTNIAIHWSQYPESIKAELIKGLRDKRINHKFHYTGLKQAQKWLALHQSYAPSKSDPNCTTIYNSSFKAAVNRLCNESVLLLGLGVGNGEKETRILQLLQDAGKEITYAPVDVSVELLLRACQAA